MDVPPVIHNQRYSSLDSRYEIETVVQTVLPPALPPRTQRNNFTFEDDPRPTSSNNIKSYCAVSCLIVSCCISSVVNLGFLGYAGWTAYEIFNWESQQNDNIGSDLWKNLDETTLCMTLSGRDLHHSGCAQYLLHDISDNKNYTCCVRDSTQYSQLYQLINQEQKRLTSAVNNDICSHSNAIPEVLSNGSLIWKPVKNCVINGRGENSTAIEVWSTNLFRVYLSITIKFEKTYKELPNQRVQIKLYRRHFNSTNDNVNDELLLHKKMDVRKEFQNFENIFLQGSFKLYRGDTVYVKVLNPEYVYKFEELCSIGLYKIH